MSDTWHACQPNYNSNLHVMLYFVKYNNSIPFFKEQSCQANKVLIDCCNQFNNFAVEHMYILVQNLMFSFNIS